MTDVRDSSTEVYLILLPMRLQLQRNAISLCIFIAFASVLVVVNPVCVVDLIWMYNDGEILCDQSIVFQCPSSNEEDRGQV